MRSLLKAKPEPKKQKKRAVGIRKAPVKVRVKVTDKRSEAYDSSSFKNKLKMRRKGQRDKSIVLKNIEQVAEESKKRDDPVEEEIETHDKLLSKKSKKGIDKKNVSLIMQMKSKAEERLVVLKDNAEKINKLIR